MNEEELDNIQELVERKITLAEVTGGLTSSDKKFIALWNYTMNLQDKINKAIEVLKLCNSQCAKETMEILKGDNND